jgi:DNA-binding response OmpR family regulator
MPPAPESREDEARLSGARAEFAGSLPRRLETLRAVLLAAEQVPGDADRVKGLLRRVHAVGAAARVLGFASVAEALAEAERSVRQAAAAGKPAPFEEVSRAFDVLPSLVLGAPVSQRGPESLARAAAPSWPTSVLVLGSVALAGALEGAEDGPAFECERFDDAPRLAELAHIVGPDVVVVDGDLPGAREAVAKLFADRMLEPTPVVIVGSFEQPESAAQFVELGVARVLPKPCSPDTLRRTVVELRDRAARLPAREPLGEITISALAERIAGEFKRGLVDALETSAPNASVAFGEGHDVLAAVWGAVARVRELVTLRSGGGLRFEQTGPEGGVPFAPWSGGERRAGERGSERAGDVEGVSLHGRRIVVADDDPAVVWFMAEILRSVGVEVLEAHDGKRALEFVFNTWPDAVVSDVLMPKLDGFSLCHEIKRDVAVRDLPVILLSWKEDLLQRVRELGADADGYLRKEATASAVVERVREILRARARVEQRIQAGGEVRGRLDGLTPRLVLDLVCKAERDARVSVRDAAFLFEAQVRGGRLVSLTRSAPDGSFLRGAPVLGSLLGAAAGRFSVEPDASACRNELSGSLFEVLAEPIARARRALAAVSAGPLLLLERVELDHPLVEAYLACTPEPAAGVVRRLLEGQSPAELIVSGAVGARLLEVVLSDIARRGGILSFVAAPAHRSVAPPAPTPPPRTVSLSAPGTVPTAATAVDAADAGWFEHQAHAEPVDADALRVPGDAPTMPLNPDLTPAIESEPMLRFGMGPATLEGMGMPPVAGGFDPPAPETSPLSPEPELGAHVIGLIGESAVDDGSDPAPAPARPEAAAEPPAEPLPAAPTTPVPMVHPSQTLRSSEPPRALAADSEPPRAPDPKALPTEPPQRAREAAKTADASPSSSVGRLVLRSAVAGALAFGATTWLLLPLFGGDKEPAPSPPTEPPALAAPSGTAPAPAPAPVELSVEELEPPAGIQPAAGQGIIEVEAPGPEPIYVDDAFVGLGPLRRISAAAGAHRVEVRGEGAARRADITLAAGKRSRITATAKAPPAAPPAPR